MSAIDQVATLSTALPEYIQRLKYAGDIDGAIRAINLRLQNEKLPRMMRDRLVCEKERLRRLPTQYPWNREQALAKFQELVPDMTDEELSRLEDEGCVDFIFINGEKRYFVRFHRSLVKSTPELAARAGKTVTPDSPWLDPMIAEVKSKGIIRRRITLENWVSVEEEAFEPGLYHAYLPVPILSAQQSDITIETDANYISADTAKARTAWWECRLDAPKRFTARYSYTATIRYADPLHAPAPEKPLYPNARPVAPEDLSEETTFISFTPYLRSLAAEICEGLTTPVEKAWAIYCFVTRTVTYAFVRDYFQIDHIGEYCAANLKGDCGLQALLFISLCRIVGIPARWQSGMSVDQDGGGSHDWAQFWLEGWGWLFCDPSYGGGAWRCGSEERHAYYFGNLDPCRMAANRVHQAAFDPQETFLRYDPYDNQDGEVELVGREVPFTGRQLDSGSTLVSLEIL